MLAYGKLSKDMMNNGYVGCKLGFEFSGLLSGKRIMGVAKQAVATHVFARDYLVSLPFQPSLLCIQMSPLLGKCGPCHKVVVASPSAAECVAIAMRIPMVSHQSPHVPS